MTVIRLPNGNLMLHSPCNISPEIKQAIDRIGKVAYIVAPGTYHYLHVPSAQQAFPEAETYICPGIESKCPDLEFDWILADRAPDVWKDDLEQVLVRGNQFIWEIDKAKLSWDRAKLELTSKDRQLKRLSERILINIGIE
ncbi:hypothetical protein AY600_01905 [Phormidium willei BDU 130791]|nr:hypothetical protein AY600_01905 [Phormidium willei BDU 130791]